MKKNKKSLLLIILLFTSLVSAQTLKPGDGINLTFYNIEDPIQGQYKIEQDYSLNLPYLGRITTYKKDFAEIKNEIMEKYSKIYKDPEMYIQPLLRVEILGEVFKPGVYYLTGFESLTDLLALAGGETKDSKLDDIKLFRDGENYYVDMEEFIEGKNNLSDIGIRSGDKIYVPRSWWVGARDASIVISGAAVLVTLISVFSK